MPMYLIAFPLLIIPFVLYNMVAFLLSLEFSTPLFNVPLLSGRSMSVNTGDVLVILAVLLLYLEILKATRLSSKTIMDHVLSMILFLGMAIEFIAVQRTATSTFLILVALAFVDVIGGFTISIRTAQRSVTVDETDRVVTG
jgi:energy-coupling factor transporter transmembrane protein EcfT